jgi:hypothetical protein
LSRGTAYWITGLVAATAARMISEGKAVRRGVNFLVSAVDPSDFMRELQKLVYSKPKGSILQLKPATSPPGK